MAIDPHRSFLGPEFKRVYRQLTVPSLPTTKKHSATEAEFGIARGCYELALLPVFAADRATQWMLVGVLMSVIAASPNGVDSAQTISL